MISAQRCILLIIFSVILWSVAACDSSPSASPTPSPFAEDSTKVIRFFTTESDPAQMSTLLSLVDEYQQLNPDIEIDIVLSSPGSRGRRLLTSLAAGSDLGIFEIEPTLTTEWTEADYLLPLDDVVEAIGVNDYIEGSLFNYRGHTYAIPYATSVYGLWLRTDLFEQAGLPIPTTFEEVLHAAEVLTKDEVYGIALPGGQNIATVNYFSPILWQSGGDYFSCEGTVVFDQPAALEAIEKWAALTRFAPPGFTTWGFSEQIEAFTQGSVAMVVYAGRLGVHLDENTPELADHVTVIFPPWGNIKVTLGVTSRFAIAKGTQHQAEAKAFLQWLLSEDRLLRYDSTVPGHMIPPLNSVRAMSLTAQSPYANRHQDWLQSFYAWLPYTSHPAMNMGVIQDGEFAPSFLVPPWSEEVFGASGIIVTMLQEISLGQRSPQDAWQDAVTQMESVVETWRNRHPNVVSPPCP